MDKLKINLLCAQVLGYENPYSKHTHIVWGKKDGRLEQINIFMNTGQLLEVANILKRMHSKETWAVGVLVHMIQTRDPIEKALEDFIDATIRDFIYDQ